MIAIFDDSPLRKLLPEGATMDHSADYPAYVVRLGGRSVRVRYAYVVDNDVEKMREALSAPDAEEGDNAKSR